MPKEVFASVAAFKRAMQPGSQWATLHQYLNPTPAYPDGTGQHVTDMGVRRCEIAQSNSFALRDEAKPRPSWCDWPKASEFTSPAPGVAVITKPGFVRLTYSLVESEAAHA